MRFNVHGFDQKIAIEFGLSNDELLILRHFEDFVCSGKMDSFYENGYMFYWVNYEKFLNDLPILNITKERLGEIMVHSLGERPKGLDAKLSSYSEKMLKKVKNRKYIGILRSKAIKNPTIGIRSYFSFTNKFYELKRHITSNDNEINTDSVLIPDRVGINTDTDSVLIPIQTRYQYRNKDYSINDYSINDNIPPNKKTNNKPKVDYLDLSFLDLDIEKVKLTKEEYDKLISKFGKKYIHDKIVSLENYIVNGKGSRYKSHYRALLTWGNADTSKGILQPVTKTKNPLTGFKEL
ncbi:hypothetical protein [Clostridioides difficile]|uniref:hypothetical protein n=1 Tax=Clostridioides difficile TaxID=1496 RepID=UPI001F18D3DC|nr:hypothetical protein [Clostridioides difficile]